MDAEHELKSYGEILFDDMKDHAKIQLNWINLASTSFTTNSLRQEL